MNLFTSLLILVIFATERLYSVRSLKLELLHRDAVSGGFYGGVEEKLRALHRRDARRSLLLRRRSTSSAAAMPMHSGADSGTGEYFVGVRVGSPGQKFMLVADTGSDLTWINCRYRCGRKCGTHKGRMKKNRVFLADRSSSFTTIPCESDMCKIDLSNLFSLTTCPTPLTPCAYDYRYFEGSSAMGFFANETISVRLTNGRKKKLKNVVIGCTERTSGDESGFKGSDGILGLGFSPNAFTARAAHDFGAKFSYCLVDHLSPRNVSNFIVFGHHTAFFGPMQTTDLLLSGPLYGVAVAGISIGADFLDIPPMAWDPSLGGGTVLDSGTSLTFLAEPAYGPLTARLSNSTSRLPVDDGGPFEFCFNSSGFDAPRLRVHFAGGAVFEPPVKSYVIDVAPGKKCLGFVSATWPGTSVIGNILQQNHFWEFDLDHRKLRFAPSTCT